MKKVAFLVPSPYNWLIWLNALVMLTGLIFFNWRPVMVVMGYLFETIIIGLIHICKLFVVTYWGKIQQESVGLGETGKMNNGFGIIFFIIHYFFFISVQSIFIFTFLEKVIPIRVADANLLNVWKSYWFLIQEPDMVLIFASLTAVHIANSVKNFFIPQRYHDYTVSKLMMQPYIRIFVQQFVAIMSGFFFLFFPNGMAIVLLLLAVRLLLDTYLIAIKYNEVLKETLLKKLSKDGENEKITLKDIELFLE